MPDPPDRELTPDRNETERLSLAWNALVRGETGAIETLDAEDAAVIRRLGELSPPARPRQVFVNRLKGGLMDSTVSVSAHPATSSDPPLSAVPTMDEPVVVAGRGRGWWNGLRLDLGVVATTALVFVIVMSGYFALTSPVSDGNGRAPAGTPPSLTDIAPDCANYGLWCPAVHPLGNGFVNKPDYAAEDLAASRVQLQDWELDPGARIEFAGGANPGVRGATVDFVIAGAYAVTVDGPAAISRASSPMIGYVEYLAPGTTAELSRGDAISYPTGRARTIVNPLSTVTMHVKSVVFYDGDVALTRPGDPQPFGVRVRVDGDGVLPRSLADYGTREVVAMLDYIQVYPETELPDERYGMRRIIGPVDPEQPGIEEGYVLWVGESRG